MELLHFWEFWFLIFWDCCTDLQFSAIPTLFLRHLLKNNFATQVIQNWVWTYFTPNFHFALQNSPEFKFFTCSPQKIARDKKKSHKIYVFEVYIYKSKRSRIHPNWNKTCFTRFAFLNGSSSASFRGPSAKTKFITIKTLSASSKNFRFRWNVSSLRIL